MAEMTLEDMIKKIISMKSKHKDEVERVLPIRIGNAAVNIFVQNFDKQGFDAGNIFTPWPEVQRRLQGLSQNVKSHRYKNSSSNNISSQLSNILVRSGRGRKSVQNSLRSPLVSGGLILIPFEVDAGYMGYHNEGGEKTGRPPQRKFMGDSDKLRDMINKEVQESFNRIVS